MTKPRTVAEARARIAGCQFPDCVFCIEASNVIAAIAARDAFVKAANVAHEEYATLAATRIINMAIDAAKELP
jgi:hypothetical protein